MNPKTLLTYPDVVTRVENAAAGRLDYVNAVPMTQEHPEWDGDVYEGGDLAPCVYLTPEGQPSCIVGQAFYDDLTDLGLTPMDSMNTASVGALMRGFLGHRYDFTRKAARFLEVVQDRQDSGEPWGTAIRAARLSAEQGPYGGADYDDSEPYDLSRFYFA